MFEDIKFQDIKAPKIFEDIKAPKIFDEQFVMVDFNDNVINEKIDKASENIKETYTNLMNNG